MDQVPFDLDKFQGSVDLVLTLSETEAGHEDCGGHVFNGFMAARPNTTFIRNAIGESLKRIESSWRGKKPRGMLRTCEGIAGPILLGDVLCASMPKKETCEFSGGGLRGAGCKVPHGMVTLSTGEVALIMRQHEDITAKAAWRRVDHYQDQCKENKIYKE